MRRVEGTTFHEWKRHTSRSSLARIGAGTGVIAGTTSVAAGAILAMIADTMIPESAEGAMA